MTSIRPNPSRRAERAAEDPNLWNDTRARPEGDAGAHRARRPTHLDRPHRAGARRPGQHDRTRRGREGSERSSPRPKKRSSALKAEAARRETRGAAVRRSRRQRQLSRSACRRRRHREPGLGQHAAAHVYALGRAARLQGRDDGRDAGRRSRHQVGDRAGQGPQRLWLAQDRARRASAGAHLAVRFQCAPAHILRQRQRLSGDRRPHPGRHQGIRRAHRYHCARAAPAASTSTRPSPRSA